MNEKKGQTAISATDTSHTSASETDNSKSDILLERDKYGIFDIVTTEKGTFIGLGSYKISDLYESKQNAIEALERKDWGLIINITSLCIELGRERKLIDEFHSIELKKA